jgi:hypothetical protein
MQEEITPNVLTRRDLKLPADGGVLIGYTFATNSNAFEKSGSDPSDVTWTATSGKTNVVLTRTSLAPGLSVYRPPANVTAFKLANKDRDHGSYTHEATSAPTAMPAPEPKAIKSKTESGFRSMTTTTTLKLVHAAPPDAVAIIAYDASGKPQLFAGLPDTHDKLLEFELDQTGGHCGTPHPNGQGSLAGKITFAWVDAFGRLSPQSKGISE